MHSIADNNVTVVYSSDHKYIVDALHAVAGSSPCHFTNGIYARQELPLRETLLAGFRYMMDREISDTANPPVLVIAVNSDKSVTDFNMMKGVEFPTYEERVKFLGAALRLLEPDSQIVFFPYDEETPDAIFDTLKRSSIYTRSIHKHANYGRGAGFPIMPGSQHFEVAACFPLLNEQTGLYEQQTERSNTAGQIVADLYSAENPMGVAYLSADAKSPRLLFPIPVALRAHMAGYVESEVEQQAPEPK